MLHEPEPDAKAKEERKKTHVSCAVALPQVWVHPGVGFLQLHACGALCTSWFQGWLQTPHYPHFVLRHIFVAIHFGEARQPPMYWSRVSQEECVFRKNVQKGGVTRVCSKIVSQECLREACSKNVQPECPTRVFERVMSLCPECFTRKHFETVSYVVTCRYICEGGPLVCCLHLATHSVA